MKLEITEEQKIINGTPQEVQYRIVMDRDFKAEFVSPLNLIQATFYKDELEALRDTINNFLNN